MIETLLLALLGVVVAVTALIGWVKIVSWLLGDNEDF